MKKLSIAVVLMAAGVTFANAQSKEAQKKVTTEAAQVAELRADTSTLTTKADVVRAQEAKEQAARVETVQVQPADARRDPAVEQQKATIKKEETRKIETKK